jgi:hypothetical protein
MVSFLRISLLEETSQVSSFKARGHKNCATHALICAQMEAVIVNLH